MNKGLVFYILLSIVAIFIVIELFISRSPFGKNNTSFAVKPDMEISGIDLIQGDKRLSLRKDGEKWTVNKLSEARKSAVLFLIRTLKDMKIKSPVSEEMFKKEVIETKIEPVKVIVYSKQRQVNSFFVYMTASNIYGNIMKIRPSAKPFIVYMPGYEENIGSHFIVNQLFWQPFTVFKLLPSQIKSVEMKNIKYPPESFTIRSSGDDFTLDMNGGNLSVLDSSRVKRYISYFVSVGFESWALDLNDAQRREIESSEPLYIINVTRSDGDIISLTIHEKWNTKGDAKEIDTDRVWAETNNGKGLFIIRYFDLDPILKKKSYFFGG